MPVKAWLVPLLLCCVPRVAADDIDVYLRAAGDARAAAHVHLLLDWRPELFQSLCEYDLTCQAVDPEAPGAACAPGQVCFSAAAYRRLLAWPDAPLAPPATGDTVTRFDALLAVLGELFATEAFAAIRVSLWLSNAGEGATVLQGYRDLGTGAGALLETLRQVPRDASVLTAHPLQPKHAIHEWYRYINGAEVLHGGSTEGNYGGAAGPGLDPATLDGAAPGRYASPIADGACPRLFSLVLALGEPDEDDDLDAVLRADLGIEAPGELSFEALFSALHQGAADLLPAVAGRQFLDKSWVVTGAATNATNSTMAAWARAGGTGLLSIEQPLALERALAGAFRQVISLSSTLVSPTVPVAATDRVAALENLYLALFEAQSVQDWPGNLKRLRLVDDPNGPDGRYDQIVDAKGHPGFETTGASAGRIAAEALTFWTEAAALPPVPALSQLDPNDPAYIPEGVDGRVVSRGGAGQKIPGFIAAAGAVIGDVSGPGTRRLFVEDPESPTGLSGFDATDALAEALQAALGAASPEEARDLIRWGRGQAALSTSEAGEPRAWILADILHSRPVAVNYGGAGAAGYDRQTNPNIRLFFGSGDGVFHMLENTDASGANTGAELFGFLPRETLGNLKVRRDRREGSLQMRYGVDGAPAVLAIDANEDGDLDGAAGDEVYVYVGLRRGGHAYYALDVSDPDPAAIPTLAWAIRRGDPGFEELGLTFSTPVVGRVKYGGEATDVVIFGGGYHGGWDGTRTGRIGKDLGDADDVSGGVSVGNALYIVDARSGELVWKAVFGSGRGALSNTVYRHDELVDSIPSAVAALEDSQGYIHRLYVGDTGGALWRVDLPVGEADNHRRDHWYLTKLAELGTDGRVSDRRFFHAPDLVQARDAAGPFDGILVSSGNRAAPLETEVANYHFYLKDRDTVSGARPREASALDITDLPDQSACVARADLGTARCGADLGAGWRIAMAEPGEKGLATPLVDGGRVFFTSYVPPGPTPSCGPPEGSGRLYLVNLANGSAAARSQRIYELGPGIPPGATALGDLILLPGRGAQLGDAGDASDGGADGGTLKLTPSLARRLYDLYWREPGIDSL